MCDVNTFLVGSAGEGIQTVGDVFLHTSDPNAPWHDALVVLALNSTAVTHYGNMAGSNCLALGNLSPGGEEISVPFQYLAKEQFGSFLLSSPMSAVLRNDCMLGFN